MQALAPIPEKLSISPFGIAIYSDYSYLEKRTKPGAEFKMPSNKTGGILSDCAKKNLKNCVGYLILKTQKKYRTSRNKFPNISKKIGFITLTLPATQKHSDKFLKENCLNQFLVELRKYNNVQEYVWRAEKQANGNLHIHLLVNVFIPHDGIRERWNRILDKYGYVQQYKNKFAGKTFREFIQLLPVQQKKGHRLQDRIRQYQRGIETNWTSPNSTDIHNLKHVDNAARYISKYVSKSYKDDSKYIKKQKELDSNADELSKMFHKQELEEIKKEFAEKQKIDGRLWFASETLTGIESTTAYLNEAIKSELDAFVEWSGAKLLKTDFCIYICKGIDELAKFARGDLSDLVKQWA